jgi:hypothetical protein
MVCWKVLDEGYNFSSNLISIEGLHTKLWAPKIARVPIMRISKSCETFFQSATIAIFYHWHLNFLSPSIAKQKAQLEFSINILHAHFPNSISNNQKIWSPSNDPHFLNGN